VPDDRAYAEDNTCKKPPPGGIAFVAFALQQFLQPL
jgi:hypothetical protein